MLKKHVKIALCTCLFGAIVASVIPNPRMANAAQQPSGQAPSVTSTATDISWPREFEQGGKRLIVHQPQVDEWKDYKTIRFRCAISVDGVLGEERFGVAEVEADTLVDHTTRMVAVMPRTRQLRFAGATDAEAATLTAAVDELNPKSVTIIALDRVIAYLENAEQPTQPRVELNLQPPPIFASVEPAILVIFVGKPVFKPVGPQSPNLQFAINTNWDVLFDTDSKQYFLLDGDGWISSSDPVNGSWMPATQLPFKADSFPADDNWAAVRERIPGEPAGAAPRVFVSTGPAELIVTDGPPRLAAIPNTNLSRVENTESVLFHNATDGKYYFLAAGRWFSAKDLAGPWDAASTNLPGDFAQIPDGDASEFVKAAVPGTPEAKDAVLLASIPNETTVSLRETPVQVVYNGEPKFVAADGTTLKYAVNTPYSVFFVDGRYYCCDQGVWFTASTAMGPWSFATSVPAAIYTLPPSNPHYNVTYVTVEAATPTTVTYTQTSGYSGEFVAATGVLMFGAGMIVGAAIADDDNYYYYPPYPSHYSYGCGAVYHYGYGGYYAAGHVSYGPYGGAGRAAAYNPATGTYARSAYAYGPYGSSRAAAAYNPYTGARAAARQVSTPYGSAGRGAAYNPTTGNYARGGYASGEYGSAGFAQVGNARTGQSATVGGITTDGGGSMVGWNTEQGQGRIAQTGSGDVYASHDGTVYKRNDDGSWASNSGSGWQSPSTSQARSTSTAAQGRPTSREAASTASTNQRSLDRQASARERGNSLASRSSSFERSSGGSSRGAAGGRSGGGGRRR